MLPHFEPIDRHYYPSVRIAATAKVVESKVFRIALYWLEFYVNALVLQWNRMGESLTSREAMLRGNLVSRPQGAKAFSQLGDRLTLDIHFYLICWDKIKKHFRVVSGATDSRCIKDVWSEIQVMSERASRARHFFEHLDKTVAEGNFGELGYGFANLRTFVFRYFETSGKKGRIERQVTLGRDEVENVMMAYESVLTCLEADLADTALGRTMA